MVQLLKPEFLSHNFISKQQENEIFHLIHQLIQTLQSPEIAIDERHAPRLHARFLTGLLSRYKRDVATTGRLHTQPPPTQDQYARGPHAAPGPQGPSTSLQQQTFSTMPGAPGSDHGMGTSHSSPDSLLTEPVYEPEAAYTADAGPLDFDSAMGSEEDVVGALRILNTPAYWSDMMTPGYVALARGGAITVLTPRVDSKTSGVARTRRPTSSRASPAYITPSAPSAPLASFKPSCAALARAHLSVTLTRGTRLFLLPSWRLLHFFVRLLLSTRKPS